MYEPSYVDEIFASAWGDAFYDVASKSNEMSWLSMNENSPSDNIELVGRINCATSPRLCPAWHRDRQANGADACRWRATSDRILQHHRP